MFYYNIFEKDKNSTRKKPSSGTYNILLLEDERSVNNNLAKEIVSMQVGLTEINFTVYRAYYQSDAEEIAQAVKIDIFLLDIYLSEIRDKKRFLEKSGFYFAKTLRGLDKINKDKENLKAYSYDYDYRFTPIIFLSSENRESRRIPIHDEVFPIAYLEKPYSFEKVQRAIEHITIAGDIKYDAIKIQKADGSGHSILGFRDILWTETETASTMKINSRSGVSSIKTDLYAIRKSELSDLTSFIKFVPNYLINPIHIKKYDLEADEIVIEYPLPGEKKGEKRISTAKCLKKHKEWLELIFRRMLY